MKKKTLSETGRHSPVVVLLGAGASVDAGLPVSTQITQRLADELQQRSETELLHAIDYIAGALNNPATRSLGLNSATLDIELLLRTATSLAEKQNNPLSKFVSQWHEGLTAIDPSGDGVLFRRLMRETKSFLPQLLQPNKAVRYLAEVHRLMGALPNKHRLAPVVFTLNYDLCLEQALREANLQFTTGFRRGMWSPSEFVDPRRIRIFKLHGSLGWVRHPERRVLFDANESLQSNAILLEGPDVNHEIVFAVDNKLQAAQPFLWLFQQCAEFIAQASYVVCIGYSFRDEHVNEIIGQALAADPSKCLIFVSPDAGEGMLRDAQAVTFYPNRVIPIRKRAKRALTGDAILSKIEAMESSKREDKPF